MEPWYTHMQNNVSRCSGLKNHNVIFGSNRMRCVRRYKDECRKAAEKNAGGSFPFWVCISEYAPGLGLKIIISAVERSRVCAPVFDSIRGSVTINYVGKNKGKSGFVICYSAHVTCPSLPPRLLIKINT